MSTLLANVRRWSCGGGILPGIVPVVLKVLAAPKLPDRVASDACEVLQLHAEMAEGRHAVLNAGGAHVLVRVLATHKSSVSVTASAINALAVLARPVTRAKLTPLSRRAAPQGLSQRWSVGGHCSKLACGLQCARAGKPRGGRSQRSHGSSGSLQLADGGRSFPIHRAHAGCVGCVCGCWHGSCRWEVVGVVEPTRTSAAMIVSRVAPCQWTGGDSGCGHRQTSLHLAALSVAHGASVVVPSSSRRSAARTHSLASTRPLAARSTEFSQITIKLPKWSAHPLSS